MNAQISVHYDENEYMRRLKTVDFIQIQ
jgi:hypothetical protein